MEKEVNGSINFLDVKITRNSDNSISTSTYRKPTFTGVMLNWNSLTSIKYKKGLISCLLDRSNKICSTEAQRIEEMEDLRNLLIDNNYPPHIIENEELKQKIKMLEEENARLRGELEVPKVNESSVTTPTRQMFAPTAQTMNRDKEKENSKSDNYCCFICCISDDSSRTDNGNCCCCCEGGGGGGCEGGCDD